jgi:cholinesterase
MLGSTRWLVSAALLASSALAVGEIVDVGYASYKGQRLPNGLSQWLGMRYAAPPLGDLRFMPPQDPEEHDAVQPADQVRCFIRALRESFKD